LKELRDLPRLTKPDLNGTRATDASPKELKLCRKLETPYLRNTPVIGAGVKDLTDALPRCDVKRERWAHGRQAEFDSGACGGTKGQA